MYAGGRPLWHLSLAAHTPRGPQQVLSWSPTTWRKMEALRDRILFGTGTSEPFIAEEVARVGVAMHWRKPLSLAEVNRMAPTQEVRERPGRA